MDGRLVLFYDCLYYVRVYNICMITQAQLAKKLGVSQQAVSFALNGTGTLAQATRERILLEAGRQGYRKNMASLTMQTGKTRSVGLLVRGHGLSRMPQPLIMGAMTWLEQNDHSLSIVPVFEQQLNGEEPAPLPFREHRVDGCLVLLRREYECELMPMLRESRLPQIWINENFATNAAYPDDVFLGRRGTEILQERGCGRVAYAGRAESFTHYSEKDRLAGYREAVAREHLVDVSTVEKAVEFLRRDECPDGVLCYGMGEADNLMLAVRELGIRVPEDLKLLVIGEAGSAIGSVPCAVLRIPMYHVGIKAMEMLENRMDDPDTDLPSQAVRHEELDVGATL
jgi:LacI family transcriptional regulator